MSKKSRTKAAADVIAVASAPAPVAVKTPGASRPDSIRGTIRGMLLGGKDTKEIAVVLAEKFPGTAAALKSTKHIAFYRSKMRKAGELPAVVTAATAARDVAVQGA